MNVALRLFVREASQCPMGQRVLDSINSILPIKPLEEYVLNLHYHVKSILAQQKEPNLFLVTILKLFHKHPTLGGSISAGVVQDAFDGYRKAVARYNEAKSLPPSQELPYKQPSWEMVCAINEKSKAARVLLDVVEEIIKDLPE